MNAGIHPSVGRDAAKSNPVPGRCRGHTRVLSLQDRGSSSRSCTSPTAAPAPPDNHEGMTRTPTASRHQNHFRAALFDMNGTLTNPEEIWTEAVELMTRRRRDDPANPGRPGRGLHPRTLDLTPARHGRQSAWPA